MTEPKPPADAPPPDYHRTPTRSFWPDLDEYNQAKDALGERGRYVSDFLRACLSWFNHSPAAALDVLGKHWPEPRRPGRPRQDEAAGNQPAEQD